jgi:GNAT superfamily N-acetyltransferase
MSRKPAGYSVRTAKRSDIAMIVAQRRAMFVDVGRDDKRQLDRMDRRFAVWVRPRLRTGEYREWFAVDREGQAAAGAAIWIMDWPPVPMDCTCRRGYVLNVYTHPSHRRKGLARMLMKAILAWCRRNGFVMVTLHASDYGRALYEALGFKPTSEMRLQLRKDTGPRRRAKRNSRAR